MIPSEALAGTVRPDIYKAARRAYELGRAEGAAWKGGLAALLGVPAYRMCGHSTLAGLCLVGAAIAVAAGRFRGGEWERGSRVGILAGVAPCLLPAALQAIDPSFCASMMMRGVPWPCVAGGLTAGLVLGFQHAGASRTGSRWPFWAGAAVSLSLIAALGCLSAGVAGFAGLLVGVVGGGVPAIALRRQLG